MKTGLVSTLIDMISVLYVFDCLIILFCVHNTYNFDYKVHRSAMMFLEKATFGMNLHDGQIPLCTKLDSAP